MPYEVQTFVICGGWVNCWSIEENGVSKPQVFESRLEAQAELDDFMAEIQDEIINGERNRDEGCNAEEFKIVKIPL